jgi:hypothetical protein
MMGVRTKEEAEATGTAAKALLTSKGWKLRVWENDGWHWELCNHIISLHSSRLNQHGKFWALVTDEVRSVGSGAMLFSDPAGVAFEHADPNVVVERAMAYATKVVAKLSGIVAAANRRLAA